MSEPAFMECDTCREQPGTPLLCEGCLHNRTVIEELVRTRAAALEACNGGHGVEECALPNNLAYFALLIERGDVTDGGVLGPRVVSDTLRKYAAMLRTVLREQETQPCRDT